MFVMLILAATFSRSLLTSKVHERYFHVFDKMLLGKTSASKYLVCRSDTECTMHCSQDATCCMASYESSTRRCILDFCDPCYMRPDTAKGTSVLLTDIPCVLPPAVQNATCRVNKDVSSGKVEIMYACDDILVLGDPVRECVQGLVWSGNAPKCGSCPEEWRYHGTSCYRVFIAPKKNWAESQDVCKRNHGKLVEIETKEENDFVRQQAMNSKQRFVWLGGTMMHTGYWHWSTSGEKMTFTDWGPGEPSSESNEVVLNLLNSGLVSYRWNNAPPDHVSAYICEISLV